MLIPVILSGGAGSRLWPVSREASPKPFMALSDGETLLGKTLKRALAVAPDGPILTVTNRDYYFKTKDEYSAINAAISHCYLLEPFGRNTAPAVALAAHQAIALGGSDAIMLVLPADHLINDLPAFVRDVQAAMVLATAGHLVTFGIPPTAPETGFGYIELSGSSAHPEVPSSRLVQRFVEKPELAVAVGYLAAGHFVWNSGMFCFKASTLLAELANADPAYAQQISDCYAQSQASPGSVADAVELHSDSFKSIRDVSIDYAVMEKAANVACIPAAFDWSDIGSWSAIKGLTLPDGSGNAALGEALMEDSHNCYIHGDRRLIATVGVSNLIVVDTPDALLVADASRTQDVKKIVERLKASNHETYRFHRTVSRPWGSYTVLEEGLGFKIKRIEVKPGASLSLQYHHHRSEHWIVVEGSAKVTNGQQALHLQQNESTFIPATHHHRLENITNQPLAIIEVQTGTYLGEDDIVRVTDVYGRVK